MKRFKIVFIGASEDFSYLGLTTMVGDTEDEAIRLAQLNFKGNWGDRGGQMLVRKVTEIPMNDFVNWNIDGEQY